MGSSTLEPCSGPPRVKAPRIHEGGPGVWKLRRALGIVPPVLVEGKGSETTAGRQRILNCWGGGMAYSALHRRTVSFLVFHSLLLRSILRSWWQGHFHGL